MNDFSRRYAKLNRSQRIKAREDAMAGIMLNMSMAFKGNHTQSQMKAAARKIFDRSVAIARRLP